MYSATRVVDTDVWQEAEEDVKNLATTEGKETEQDTGKAKDRKKRSMAPDPTLSAPKPRKLRFTPAKDGTQGEASESEEDDEAPHVPTPTSSANFESDGEDKDLFKNQYAVSASSASVSKPSKSTTFTTPRPAQRKSLATPASAPSSSKWSNLAEEVQDMLSGVEERVLDLLPPTLSRRGLT